MTNDPIIKIEQLEKSFGDLHVLKCSATRFLRNSDRIIEKK